MRFTRRKESTMENTASPYKFTASVIIAIQAVMKLVSPQGLRMRLKGATGPGDFTELPRPDWSNFDFFNRIEATPIRKTKRVEPTAEHIGHWVLEREVHFDFRGSPVAVVWLVGHKSDATKGDRDNNTWWAIAKIAYASECDDTGRTSFPARTFEFKTTLHVSASVSEV